MFSISSPIVYQIYKHQANLIFPWGYFRPNYLKIGIYFSRFLLAQSKIVTKVHNYAS